MPLKFLFLLLLLSLTYHKLLFAQTTDDLLGFSLEDLMNIKVESVSKKSESALSSPSTINIVTQQDLALLHCDTLLQCLEFITGFSSVNGEGNIFTTTTIRGNTLVNYNTNTLLLINSVPYYNSYHGSFDINTLPLSTVDRIEILKGSNSVLYGSNAINGVINIITKKAKKDSATTDLRYGSNQTINVNASLQKSWENGGVALFFQHYQTEAEKKFIYDEKGRTRNFAQEKNIDSVNMVSNFSNFEIYVGYAKKSLNNYKTRGFEVAGKDAMEKNDEATMMAYLTYDYQFNDDFEVQLKSTYNDWQLDKVRYNGFWEYSSQWWLNEIELHMFEATDSSNVLGISVDNGNGRRFKSERNVFDIGKFNEKTTNISLYDNGNYTLTSQFNLVYGIRYSYSEYYAQQSEKKITHDNISSRLGMVYQMDEQRFIKVIYGESYRVPSYFEKEVDSATIKPNPFLTPESSQSVDIIFSHQYKTMTYNLDVFYSEIEDKITRVALTDYLQQNQNIGNVALYGIEFDVKYYINDNMYSFITYSYTHGENTTKNQSLKFTYQHMLSAGYAYTITPEHKVDVSLKALSDWGDAKGYVLLNAAYVYSPRHAKNITIELGGRNILNQQFTLPEIARNKETVPIIPANYSAELYFGVNYQF